MYIHKKYHLIPLRILSNENFTPQWPPPPPLSLSLSLMAGCIFLPVRWVARVNVRIGISSNGLIAICIIIDKASTSMYVKWISFSSFLLEAVLRCHLYVYVRACMILMIQIIPASYAGTYSLMHLKYLSPTQSLRNEDQSFAFYC